MGELSDVTLGIGGSRLDWAEVPGRVRAAIEAHLGAQVRTATTQHGGFSPGMAARLVLADGRRVFAKAVGVQRNQKSVDMSRTEADVVAALPPSVPAPELLFRYDDGDWVALVFSDVDGRTPELPWHAGEWARVHDGIVELSASLTPSPVELRRIDTLGWAFSGWQSIVDDGLADRLDPWSRANLDAFAAAEAGWSTATSGDSLLHMDIRADNLLLTDDGVVFVDWPHAAVGAPWLELLVMLPSVRMQGGPDPAHVWASSPLARDAEEWRVTTALTALLGFFTHHSLLPAPENLPHIRTFQREQAVHARTWLRSRLP